MLAVQGTEPHPTRLSGKWAAASALGTTPAAEPIKPTQEPRRIVSSVTQQAIFVEGQANRTTTSFITSYGNRDSQAKNSHTSCSSSLEVRLLQLTENHYQFLVKPGARSV